MQADADARENGRPFAIASNFPHEETRQFELNPFEADMALEGTLRARLMHLGIQSFDQSF